jgi:xylulokinase
MTLGMAERCGLKHPIPVAAGCGDTAASFLSCGAVQAGICIDVAGTASVFAATTDQFICDTETQVMGCGASVTDGLWHPYAYINGGGMNLEWFISEILGRDRKNSERFKDLEPEKLDPLDSDPLFIPHMAGRVSPSQPEMKGTFAGLSWKHTRRNMFQAIMESVALEYGIYRNSLLKMLPDIKLKELRITGGGENSRIWKEIKSGVLQLPVVSIHQNYGAPMGSAIVAGVASGVFSSTREAAELWINTKESVLCDSRLWPHYENRTRSYESLLNSMFGYYTSEG